MSESSMDTKDRGWRQLEIERQWPDRLSREQPSTDFLTGATIIQVGRPTKAEKDRLHGDEWLVIDYRPHGASEGRRVVLQFNELALWTEAEVPISENAPESSLGGPS